MDGAHIWDWRKNYFACVENSTEPVVRYYKDLPVTFRDTNCATIASFQPPSTIRANYLFGHSFVSDDDEHNDNEDEDEEEDDCTVSMLNLDDLGRHNDAKIRREKLDVPFIGFPSVITRITVPSNTIEQPPWIPGAFGETTTVRLDVHYPRQRKMAERSAPALVAWSSSEGSAELTRILDEHCGAELASFHGGTILFKPVVEAFDEGSRKSQSSCDIKALVWVSTLACMSSPTQCVLSLPADRLAMREPYIAGLDTVSGTVLFVQVPSGLYDGNHELVCVLSHY